MTGRRGAALLIVLIVVMAVTVLSLGFLSRSDVELACGENMVLRTQMDYLAESGLEHAKGLILNPQDISSEYWTGAAAQQLTAGSSDYYDVNVMRDDSDPNDRCNYIIDCNAYRMKAGQMVGRSSLSAKLRLDPCIALWTEGDTTIWSRVTIHGDVRCNGNLTNEGILDGDVFANAFTGSMSGRHKPVADLSLVWPRVTMADFISHYSTQTISSGSLSGQTFGPYNPVRICYRNGNLVLAGNVSINGMLIVDGDLVIEAGANIITAGKNLPALLVTGDMIVGDGSSLEVQGLAVVSQRVLVSVGATGLDVLGGLFTQSGLAETTADASGNGNIGILHNGPIWQLAGGQTAGALQFDGIDDTVEDADAGAYLNGLSAITVSAWVKSDVTSQDRGLFFTRQPGGDTDADLGLRYDAAGSSGGGKNGIKASIRTTAGFTQIESGSNVQTTDWQHLALVWNNDPNDSRLKLYINGQLDSLRYDMGPISGVVSDVQKLMLGRGTGGTYWDGLIDDLRIYNQALDASDIYPPVDGLPGLITHWKLDGYQQNHRVTITCAPARSAIVCWAEDGAEQRWQQAAGAFFRSLSRTR